MAGEGSTPIANLIDNGDLVINDGYRAKNSELSAEGLPFARAKNINNGFRFEDADRFPEQDLHKVGIKISQPGDVVFTSKGTVGRFAFVQEDTPRFVYAPQLCFWRSLNHKRIHPRWLYYWMQSWEFFAQYSGVAGQTDMAEYVSLRDQRQMHITLPPPQEQQAIACILGMLDDKIELNRRMNQTLEGMARAIFKSWFVDFDPVRAKAAGQQPPGLAPHIADVFPDEFEASELGEIPKGWRARAIGDFCDIAVGGDWGNDRLFEGAVRAVCLRGVDLEHLRQSGWADAPRRWIKRTSVAKRRLNEQDILIAASGAGPMGRPLWAAQQMEAVFDLPVVYSNFCKRLRCKSVAAAVYVDRWLHLMRESGEIWEYATGTSIPNLDTKSLLGKAVVFPPEPILERFLAFIRPVTARLYSQESHTLAALRDTLLPKLISGELRVPDAEQIVKRCA